jgi:hypothetical protein
MSQCSNTSSPPLDPRCPDKCPSQYRVPPTHARKEAAAAAAAAAAQSRQSRRSRRSKQANNSFAHVSSVQNAARSAGARNGLSECWRRQGCERNMQEKRMAEGSKRRTTAAVSVGAALERSAAEGLMLSAN